MNELSKNLRCIVIRSDIEVWIEEDKLEKTIGILQRVEKGTFIQVEDRLINTADIVGIFTPQDMEERTRRKNKQWKCEVAGNWHEFREECLCVWPPLLRWKQELKKVVKNCAKCTGSGVKPIEKNGYKMVTDCDCVYEFSLKNHKPSRNVITISQNLTS